MTLVLKIGEQLNAHVIIHVHFLPAKIIFLVFFRHIVIRCISNASIGEETYGKCNNIFIQCRRPSPAMCRIGTHADI